MAAATHSKEAELNQLLIEWRALEKKKTEIRDSIVKNHQILSELSQSKGLTGWQEYDCYGGYLLLQEFTSGRLTPELMKELAPLLKQKKELNKSSETHYEKVKEQEARFTTALREFYEGTLLNAERLERRS